ncbi:MAG: molybdenum cofactor guanylyltransferase [Solirubrobacterales bacterium]
MLAGGLGSRLGGGKAWVELGGRPLCSYPLAAVEAAGLDPVLCVKAGEEPPPSRGSFVRLYRTKEPRNGVAVLEEPDEPRHPLCGIVAALWAGEGRPVVAVACDLPFVAPALLECLAAAPEPLVVPAVEGHPQPLLARYEASLLPALEAALEREEPLTRTVESLRPRLLGEDELARFGDPRRLLFNVNDRADLRQAESLLAT